MPDNIKNKALIHGKLISGCGVIPFSFHRAKPLNRGYGTRYVIQAKYPEYIDMYGEYKYIREKRPLRGTRTHSRRYKMKSPFVFGPALALALGSISTAQDPLMLKLSLQPGSAYIYIMDMNQTNVQTVDGEQQKLD